MFASRRKALITTVILISMFSPALALAAGMTTIVPDTCNGIGGCSSICDIAQLAQNILNDAIFIAVFLAAFLFAYSGFKMLISPTSPGERNKAKTLFMNVLIGFIVILAAWLIVDAIMGLLLTGNPTLPWNQIC